MTTRINDMNTGEKQHSGCVIHLIIVILENSHVFEMAGFYRYGPVMFFYMIQSFMCQFEKQGHESSRLIHTKFYEPSSWLTRQTSQATWASCPFLNHHFLLKMEETAELAEAIFN